MLRSFLQKLHHWLGISAGLVVFMLALTGSVLVFDDEIDTALNPALLRMEAPDGTPSLERARAALAGALPDHRTAFIRLPQTPRAPVQFWSADEPHRIAYVDPYRGEVLGTRGENEGVIGFLKNLHIRLLLGEAGHTANGIAGLALLVMLVSGAMLAWRKGRLKRIFTPRLKGPAAAVAFDWHRFAGTAGWALLFLSALTGVMLVFYRVTAFALILAFGGTPPSQPPDVVLKEDQAMLSLDAVQARAEEQMPQARLTWISLPQKKTDAFVARYSHKDDPHPNGTTYVALHPQTGEPVSVYAWEDKGTGMWLADLKYPIHIGDFWGAAGPVIVLLTGLVPVVLMISGGYLWLRRRGVFSRAKR